MARFYFKYEHPESFNETMQGFGLEAAQLNSSVIKYAVYNGNSKHLAICFKSGKQYNYKYVGKKTWRDFVNAESQDKFLNEHIHGHYDFELEPEEA